MRNFTFMVIGLMLVGPAFAAGGGHFSGPMPAASISHANQIHVVRPNSVSVPPAIVNPPKLPAPIQATTR
jgi:hypothetical protein